jgi:hypothetical protein
MTSNKQKLFNRNEETELTEYNHSTSIFTGPCSVFFCTLLPDIYHRRNNPVTSEKETGLII